MLNEQPRVEEELKLEKKLREMTSGELYTKLGIDFDMAVDGIRHNPTGDITNKARKAMKEVLVTTRVSKKPQGYGSKNIECGSGSISCSRGTPHTGGMPFGGGSRETLEVEVERP